MGSIDNRVIGKPTVAKNGIAFFGDSVTSYCCEARFNGDFPMTIGSYAKDMTEGEGTLDVRIADLNVRWTAPDDTPGEWVPVQEGFCRLESGSPDKWMVFCIYKQAILDSITEDSAFPVNVTENESGGRGVGYGTWSGIFSNGALQMVSNLGFVGDTTEFMRNRIRQALNLDRFCSKQSRPLLAVVIFAGLNDKGQGIPAERTLANIRYMAGVVSAAGVRPVLVTIAKESMSDAEDFEYTQEVNRGIADIAASTDGALLVDYFKATLNYGLQNGAAAADMIAGVHPKNKGAFILGEKLAEALMSIYSGQESVAGDTFPGDLDNLVANGCFVGTDGTAGAGVTGPVADDWTASCSGTVTAVASKEAVVNAPSWQVLTCSGAANDDTVSLRSDPFSVSAGELSNGGVFVDVSGASGLKNVDFFIEFSDGDTQTAVVHACMDEYNDVALPRAAYSGFLEIRDTVVPSFATEATVTAKAKFAAAGAAVIKVRKARINSDAA